MMRLILAVAGPRPQGAGRVQAPRFLALNGAVR